MSDPVPAAESLPDLSPDAARLAAGLLAEDGPLDLTSAAVLGLAYADAVLAAAGCSAAWNLSDGAPAQPGALGRIEGDFTAILRAERPMLNLLQRACGIAAVTRDFVRTVAGTGCTILHTRKTAPGLRLFVAAADLALEME